LPSADTPVDFGGADVPNGPDIPSAGLVADLHRPLLKHCHGQEKKKTKKKKHCNTLDFSPVISENPHPETLLPF
jgi:hypothetical protein